MPKFGFHRQLRLVNNNQIRDVCRKGKRRRSVYVTLSFCPNSLAHPRLCVSVGKKQIADAWQRNLVKRIVRESFRLHQYVLPAIDIVLVVFKPITMLNRKQIREVIDAQWKNLALLKSAL